MNAPPLQPDRDQIATFINALFRHADEGTFVSLRAFHNTDRAQPPTLIRPVKINGAGLAPVIEAAVTATDDAANRLHPSTFAPPICTFTNSEKARAVDVANGLVISVEIDERPKESRKRLESILGIPTLVMESGSTWRDPISEKHQPKLHLHWRLSEPTRTAEDHDLLRDARAIACQLVGADPTGVPISHPFRWAGSWNTKHQPKLARCIKINPGAEVHLVEVLDTLRDAQEAAGFKASGVPASSEPTADPILIASAMAAIPNVDAHYGDWVALGYACFRSAGAEAFGIWDRWSQKSPKYQATETEAVWKRIADACTSATPPRTAGAGTIFYHAAQAGWTRPKALAGTNKPHRRIAAPSDPDGPAPIRVMPGELHITATEGEAAILAAGLPIYQRGTTLVRPFQQDVPASHGRQTVSAALADMCVHSFVDALCQSATWEKYDARAEDFVRINPPKSVADIIMSRVGRWTFSKLVGVITTPTIRRDGSILSAHGYDPATRLYHMSDPNLTLRPSVENPNKRTAEAALKELKDLLSEFPLVGAMSMAVALSCLITPVVRGALSVAPLHLIKANAPGSGKSYVVDTASAIASGRPCPVVSVAPNDEGETEKRIAGLLLAGFPLVSLDNVNGELGGDLLCQAIERPIIRLRRLGGSDIIEVESIATIFATGNGARVRGDMTRRTVVADLDAGMERPELRQFKGDPVAKVMSDRGRYVSAALVIVRAYIIAGTPGRLPPIASFADWSNLVRSALVWLGCADPALSMEAAREDDPELEELTEVIEAWKHGLNIGEGMTVKTIAHHAETHAVTEKGQPTSDLRLPALNEALMKIAGDRGVINTRRLGKWLLSRQGRIVRGLRVKRAPMDASGGIAMWMLEPAKTSG